MMRILFVHNRYQQPGGEDSVVQAEIALLRSRGHEVDFLEEDNDGIVGWIDAASTAIESVYSFPPRAPHGVASSPSSPTSFMFIISFRASRRPFTTHVMRRRSRSCKRCTTTGYSAQQLHS